MKTQSFTEWKEPSLWRVQDIAHSGGTAVPLVAESRLGNFFDKMTNYLLMVFVFMAMLAVGVSITMIAYFASAF